MTTAQQQEYLQELTERHMPNHPPPRWVEQISLGPIDDGKDIEAATESSKAEGGRDAAEDIRESSGAERMQLDLPMRFK